MTGACLWTKVGIESCSLLMPKLATRGKMNINMFISIQIFCSIRQIKILPRVLPEAHYVNQFQGRLLTLNAPPTE